MLKHFLDGAMEKASEGLAAAKDAAVETFESTKASVISTYDSTANEASDFIAAHWPRAQEVVVNGLLTIAQDHLNDPKALTAAFETAHAAMPLPLRVAIRQDTFVAFCFTQKETLSQKVLDYKSTSAEAQLLLSEQKACDVSQGEF